MKKLIVAFLIIGLASPASAQQEPQAITPVKNTTASKMKIEIWSDIVCPFCYIGKRRFEEALAQFPHQEHIEVEWKSFQLSPRLKTDTTLKVYESLAKEKGISLQHAQQMIANVTQMAKGVGLQYNFDKAVVANTFDAHRFLHFAKEQGLQSEAKERLLKAYFTEGKNIADHATLVALGQEIGLDTSGYTAALNGADYSSEVKADVEEAQQIGISGVPFFVFNRKYGVSGAQSAEVFLQTLKNAYSEWSKANPQPKLQVIEGQNCTPAGECD